MILNTVKGGYHDASINFYSFILEGGCIRGFSAPSRNTLSLKTYTPTTHISKGVNSQEY